MGIPALFPVPLSHGQKGKEDLKIAGLLVIRAVASPTISKCLPKFYLPLTAKEHGKETCLFKLILHHGVISLY